MVNKKHHLQYKNYYKTSLKTDNNTPKNIHHRPEFLHSKNLQGLTRFILCFAKYAFGAATIPWPCGKAGEI